MQDIFLIENLNSELKDKGADFVRIADISSLSERENRGFDKAILIGILLSKKYITDLQKTVRTGSDEFAEKEHKADELSEWTVEFLERYGYTAFAQSEENNWQNGYFDNENKASSLPHKTIAVLTGLGWIGKNNLLVTEDYGCAFCMCTVLTNAPIDATNHPLVSSKCGECNICKKVCPKNAILGNTWTKDGNRNMLVDVFRCDCCLKCLYHCKWSAQYAKDVID